MSEVHREKDDFFVGYMGRLPEATRGAITAFVVCFLAAFVGGALALGAAQGDPGEAGPAGAVTLRGVIYAQPYPHLRMPPEAGRPLGRTIALNSARGKRGVQAEATELFGQTVEVTGGRLLRGEVETLQVGWRRGAHRIVAVEEEMASRLTPVEPLGRWRIAGEICDSKCYLGVMRPGRGLAHKACANLCVIGGAPAVFVAAGPIEGDEFLLLADAGGGPLPPAYRDLTALLISVEGELERRGELLVFKVDLSTAETL
ncbi:MAG: hypothetical protein KTR21_02730 [Rhodobacteraceae bacterium]|nr:hypothetical protein [Paracoccaceae bacterium]